MDLYGKFNLKMYEEFELNLDAKSNLNLYDEFELNLDAKLVWVSLTLISFPTLSFSSFLHERTRKIGDGVLPGAGLQGSRPTSG